MQRTPGKTAKEREGYWVGIIHEARNGSGGVTSYCLENHLSKNTFYAWFTRLRPDHPEWQEDLPNIPERARTKMAPSQMVASESRSLPRRSFTAAYKAQVLEEIDAAPQGQKGAILEREGLKGSHLQNWRRQRNTTGLEPLKRGRKANPHLGETKNLLRQNAKLAKELEQGQSHHRVSKKNREIPSKNREWREVTTADIAEQDILLITVACACAGLVRSTYYRLNRAPSDSPARIVARRSHPRAVSAEKREEVLALLRSERFIDKSPTALYFTLLDEGHYLCSISTMYRILNAAQEVLDQRLAIRNTNQSAKPVLLAVAPNQVWSWDITKLKKASKWGYFYYYAIIDIFSRMIVGWTVAEQESAQSAESLITKTCWEQSIEPGQLIIHSDRGAPMKSKTVGQMLIDSGVAKSLGRPRVCNDNAYSESNFKTLKSRPTFPKTFGNLELAESFIRKFVKWNNFEHRHGGIAYMTPATVHAGKATECLQARQAVLDKAFQAHNNRFVNGPPKVCEPQTFSGINIPKEYEPQLADACHRR